jgi:uncharacterized protein (TIGR03086 family)
MDLYLRSQDQFAALLWAVQPDQWNNLSPCPGWTARDIAGHEIWGLDMVRAHATGQEFGDETGAPGSQHPGAYLGPDPLAEWQHKRAYCAAALTPPALDRLVLFGPLGKIRLRQVLDSLVVDFLAHTWDLGMAIGARPRLDPELVIHAQCWADKYAEFLRSPWGLGPALPTPPDADPQTRLLRCLGRDA